MSEPTSASPTQAQPGKVRKPRSQAKPGKAGETDVKESRASQILHELMRKVGFDARSDKHASELIREFGELFSLAMVLSLCRMMVFLVFAVHFAVTLYHGFSTGNWGDSHSALQAGLALDLTGFTVTAPGAAGTAMTAFTGDPASVRNGTPGSKIRMIGAWCKAQGTGSTKLVFPSGNDQTRNIDFVNIANQPGNQISRRFSQPLVPQDPFTLTEIGSAVAGDIEMAHILNFYDDLPGTAAALLTVDDVDKRLVRFVTIQGTLTAAAGGVWSGSTALTGFTQFLRANTTYAFLGAKMSAICGALAMHGPDTGNLRVGIPGLTAPDDVTVNWFSDLSEWLGLPLIPTFNSANNAGTFLEISQDENLAAVAFSLNLAELAAA